MNRMLNIIFQTGSGILCNLILSEGRGPMFVDMLQNVTVSTGSAMQMTVTATGNPLPKIEIFRNVNGT